ncbi:MAG: Crp/Fnr family transcriptional regulator [Alphaproteobacteria bacterium]|nr:Crp/Fnr family transcriptional regulator [Alphaproteobacteria bacterium]
MDTDLLDAVRGLTIFSKVPANKVELLLRGSAPRAYPKGHMLFQQGDPADSFFVVLSGWVKLYRQTPQGDEAVVHIVSRGEAFAEAAMFLGGRYPANAQIAEDAELLRISTQPFRQWVASSPEIAMGMLAALSARLHHMVNETEQLQTRSATERVADFILKRCPVGVGSAVIALPYDKSLLAARLAMKPESLSRVLAKLRKLGVKSEQHRVIVGDVGRLARFCRGEDEAGMAALR